MKKVDCDLCNRVPITSGKDKLLYDHPNYYIVENGNKDGHTRRISLTVAQHYVGDTLTEQSAMPTLRNFVESKLHIPAADFFIVKTMSTYPDHFHIHAYVLPKLEEGEK